MKRVLLVAGGATAILLLVGVAGASLVGPKRLLDRAGYVAVEERLVTGIAVGGTAGAPVVFVSSSDPRLPDYIRGERLDTDTNSGVISRLERGVNGWTRRDLVQGLPRSLHDHATNGLVLDDRRGVLYVAQGSMTSMGAPSRRFDAPEYALSAAILAVDLRRLEGATYALPTLDDETRSGVDDAGDPFGGNAGRNQAILDPDGPVTLHATGFRNPYDLVLTSRGALFATDNGPNWFWGGPPKVVDGTCTNAAVEGGRYVADSLVLARAGGYYGHPNPTRANTTQTFNASNPQSPVQRARPAECVYRRGEPGSASLLFDTSTNGLAQYTASNFDGALTGDLLAVSFDRRLYRIELDEAGRRVVRASPLAEIDGYPLDVTTQPDGAPFPGTIWVVDWLSGDLVVLEPQDRRTGAHWQRLAPSGIARQEVAWVRAGDRFYLAGGDRRHEAYDPATDSWEEVAQLPEQLDHIQGVAVDGRIYYVGGLREFPEPAVDSVWIYDPRTDDYSEGAPMPRPRGAGGVAVHDGKIYYAGGLSEGEAVPWLDAYDPATDSWDVLPDMPRPRDHFQAQVVGSRLYAIGGRETDVDANLEENDAFDFGAKRWVTGLAPLPTPRGGYASATVGDEILVLGGESPDRVFGEVEAYDTSTDTWRALEPMPEPRHGIQAIACEGDVFIAAGGEAPFGDAPSSVHSLYVADPARRCGSRQATGPASRAVVFRARRVPAGLNRPTSLQVGPDGRLYVSEQDGTIAVLTVRRESGGRYSLLHREDVELIRDIPNHDDDGSPAASWTTLARLVGRKAGFCCSYERSVPVPPATTPEPGDARRGRPLFRDADCAGCHAFEPAGSTAVSGPPLDPRANLPAAYLEQSILDPDAVIAPGYSTGVMPPDYAVTLNAQQLADIVAFIRARPRD